MRFLSVFAEVLNNVRILCVCWVCEGLGLSSVCTVVWMWAYPSACRDTGKHDRNVWRWDSTGPNRDPPAARGCWRTHPTRTDLNKKTAFILVVCIWAQCATTNRKWQSKWDCGDKRCYFGSDWHETASLTQTRRVDGLHWLLDLVENGPVQVESLRRRNSTQIRSHASNAYTSKLKKKCVYSQYEPFTTAGVHLRLSPFIPWADVRGRTAESACFTRSRVIIKTSHI